MDDKDGREAVLVAFMTLVSNARQSVFVRSDEAYIS